MEYKGYIGEIKHCDDKTGLMHGQVIGLKDVITFQGTSAEELKKAFHESVDDYLSWCKKRGEMPDK